MRRGYRWKRRAAPGDLARISVLLLFGTSAPLAISYLVQGNSEITFFLLVTNAVAVTIAVFVNLWGSPFNYEGVDDDLGMFSGTFLERDDRNSPPER